MKRKDYSKSPYHTRKRIVKEKGLPKVEEYWFMQDHDELRAAAAELLLNLIHCDEV